MSSLNTVSEEACSEDIAAQNFTELLKRTGYTVNIPVIPPKTPHAPVQDAVSKLRAPVAFMAEDIVFGTIWARVVEYVKNDNKLWKVTIFTKVAYDLVEIVPDDLGRDEPGSQEIAFCALKRFLESPQVKPHLRDYLKRIPCVESIDDAYAIDPLRILKSFDATVTEQSVHHSEDLLPFLHAFDTPVSPPFPFMKFVSAALTDLWATHPTNFQGRGADHCELALLESGT
ncbi:hypothetical protein HK102_009454 [Quaeritorhiza haematococci]|nr:hypothetical protein HK102_009454 [Quaeritorhiza haematococci]